MKSTHLACIAALTAAVMSVGCNMEPQTLESIRSVAQSVQGAAGVTPESLPITATTQVAVSFTPPFPDRVDPFSFPTGIDGEASEVTSPTMMQVKVLGFADVDEPRVFLRSRDTTRSMKVGDKADGIEVVAINVPAVELRMGSVVWTATMFDQAVPPSH